MNTKNNAVHSKESREILRGNLIDAQNFFLNSDRQLSIVSGDGI